MLWLSSNLGALWKSDLSYNKSNMEFIDPNLLLQQRHIKKQKHWCLDGVVKLQITDGLYTAFKLLPRGSDYFHMIGDRLKFM